MTETTVNVTGMTCGHCVSSVQREVMTLPTVSKVDVDLASGKVTIISEQNLERSQLAAAIEEAGYTLNEA